MAAPAAACRRHQRFPSVEQVRQAMRGHKRSRKHTCLKCLSGLRVNAWECGDHWHFGHRWYE